MVNRGGRTTAVRVNVAPSNINAPVVEGASSGELRYSSHPDRATAASAAQPRLSISPALWS
jgi:hypothetical protein